MSIKLRPETVENLLPVIGRFVELTRVRNGRFIDVMPSFNVLWEAEEVLPKSGPTRDQLTGYVGDRSLAFVLSDVLRERLSDREMTDDDEGQTLMDAMGIDDSSVIARDLLARFQSLPWPYLVTLVLPPTLGDFVRMLPPVQAFGPNLRLVHDTGKLKPETHPNNALGGLSHLATSTLLYSHEFVKAGPKPALQMRIEGFVPRQGGGETIDEAHGLMKSFFGLALAVNLFKAADFPNPQFARSKLLFHREAAGEFPFQSSKSLTDGETTALAGLSYSPFHSSQGGPLAAQSKLAEMTTILSVPDQHQLLLRASRWLFDSYASDDPLLSYVQATVALEILLGDKTSSDQVGLSTLLANRCAYMIGASTSERSGIIKMFKDIYEVRSKIVHSGKHRLSSMERTQLHLLRSLGHRVICAEIRLAIKELERGAGSSARPF